MLLFSSGANCATYPKPLASKADIPRAKAEVEDINIRRLPLEDYPLLAKFTRVKRIRLDNIRGGGEGANDEKLKALANLNLTNLINITLLNCSSVTDEGIRALFTVRSVKQLQLEGTSITDKGCEIMAAQLEVNSGVNVSNCPRITLKGLKALAASKIKSIGFSADNLPQEDVVDLVDSFNRIKYCMIVDTKGKLDANAIKAKSAEKNIQIVVAPTGALQRP